LTSLCAGHKINAISREFTDITTPQIVKAMVSGVAIISLEITLILLPARSSNVKIGLARTHNEMKISN